MYVTTDLNKVFPCQRRYGGYLSGYSISYGFLGDEIDEGDPITGITTAPFEAYKMPPFYDQSSLTVIHEIEDLPSRSPIWIHRKGKPNDLGVWPTIWKWSVNWDIFQHRKLLSYFVRRAAGTRPYCLLISSRWLSYRNGQESHVSVPQIRHV